MIRQLIAEAVSSSEATKAVLAYLREEAERPTKKLSMSALCGQLHDPSTPKGWEAYQKCMQRRRPGYKSPFRQQHEEALAEATYTPNTGSRLRTAKSLARTMRAPVEVRKSTQVPVSGIRKAIAQVWKGDRGKIISSDGNNVIVMTTNSGRVVVPKVDFERIFRYVPDEDLVFSDPDTEESI